jgi:hypothetical protein
MGNANQALSEFVRADAERDAERSRALGDRAEQIADDHVRREDARKREAPRVERPQFDLD